MKITCLLFVTLIFSLTACNFSTGVSKDIKTGLSTSNSGLTYNEAYLMNENKEKLISNKIPLNSKVSITITGAENFESQDGKVFPGASLIVTNSAGKEILNNPDLFADAKEGYPEELVKQSIFATFIAGSPVKSGDKYHMKARFWDKKGKGEIVSEVDLEIQ